MTTRSRYIKSEKSAIASSENAKGAANHRKIASQLEAAAKHHLELFICSQIPNEMTGRPAYEEA